MEINILLIITIFLAIVKICDGYKKGMIKEIISLVTLCVLSTMVALIAAGLSSYHDGKYYNMIVAVILLALLGIVHHLLGIVFFSAKMISKLPIIHGLDKLFGIVFGLFEVILFLWTLYTLIMMLELGAIGQVILTYTEENSILTEIYRHNYLAGLVEQILPKLSFLPTIINEIGQKNRY